MHYSEIKTYDIANGVGVRTSVFVSGCDRHCSGCFNAETWDFDHGIIFNERTIERIMNTMEPHYISGLSILGGEPLAEQNRIEVLNLIMETRHRYPEKSIWLWTGYIYEDLLEEMEHYYLERGPLWYIIHNIDVLVDGPYEECKKNMMLRFRGSENQRIIDIPKSLLYNKTVIWTDGPIFDSRSAY